MNNIKRFKFIRKLKLTVVLSSTLFVSVLFSQVSHSVNFSQSDLSIITIKARDSVEYEQVSMKGLGYTEKEGKPCLPVHYIKLIIPSDQDAQSIVITSQKKSKLEGSHYVFPAQPPVPTSDIYEEPDFVNTDPDVYESDNPYPAENVQIIHQGYFDGSNHIVTIAVYPLQYYPKSGLLEFYSTVDFTLELSEAKSKPEMVNFRLEKNQVMYDNILKRLVDNPEDISQYQVTPSLSKTSSVKTGTLPYYEYVIITSDDLKPHFECFINWKKRKGLDIGVVTTQEIWNDGYITDNISGITDNAGITGNAGGLREYLRDSWRYGGTVWALLAGDYSVVPIRYGAGGNNCSWNNYNVNSANRIPADLYFGDFTGDWDVDGIDNDGSIRYGEPTHDNPDYYSEIFVGRLLCSSEADILNWTEKVILYEQNPGKCDLSYLTRSFMIQSDGMQDGNEAGAVDVVLPTALQPSEIWQENGPSGHGNDPNPTFPYGYQVINEMNSTRYGLWSWFCHGAPTKAVCKSHLYNQQVSTKSYLRSWGSMDPESGNGMDDLNNTNHPAIVYSIACVNTPFDDFSTNTGERNLAEAFTSMYSGGGPAFLGNTRNGLIGSSYKLYQKFAEEISAGGSSLHIGIAEAIARANNTSNKHFLGYSHNLVGCPETKIWTEIPSLFSNVSVTDQGYPITINTGVSDCDIAVCSIDNGQSFHSVVSGVSSFTFTTSVRPLYVTITKSNYLPFIGITGGSINSDITFYGKLKIIDNITVNSGVSLTVDPGTIIAFTDDKKITVNGTLSAQGTSEAPIKFTSINQNPSVSDWYGIKVYGTANIDHAIVEYANRAIYFYDGATGTVPNCEIKNNNYGVYLYKSAPTIQDCEINDCNTGIYLYDNNYISGDADIINNSIHDHDNYGIFCYKSSPEIRENTIDENYYGVYCTNSSSPLFGAYNTRGNNIISNCYIGLSANYDSDPALYLSYPRLGGWNQFISMNYFIRAYNYSNVYAENNWWGSSPPDHNKFYAYNNSSIYYDPWLTSDPSGPPPPESSSPNSALSSSDYNPGYDENWSLKRKIDYAKSLIYLDNPAESKKICADIIDLNPDSALSFLALNVYWAADRYQSEKEKTGQKDFQDLLINLSEKKYKCELYGYSELLLADFEGDKGLSRIDKVYNEYKDSFLPEAALYQKFLYYLDAKEDLSSALVVNEQLNEEYPNSSFTKWSNEHLSKESSFNKNESLSDNDFKENQIPLEYNLFSNFPNPFNPSTRVKYALPKVSDIQIVIYNSIGQRIKSFEQIQQPRGVHFFRWDGKNDAGLKIPSGLYILRFNAVSLEEEKKVFNKSVKMLLIR